MKITKVEQFVVAVPHIPAIQRNRPEDYIERPIPIIKVHTDDGIYGLGEGGRGQRFDDAIVSWIGQDPIELKWQNLGGAFGAAIFDIVGKAFGVPAHKLMGPQHWEKVPVGYWSCPMEPEEFAAEGICQYSLHLHALSRTKNGISKESLGDPVDLLICLCVCRFLSPYFH